MYDRHLGQAEDHDQRHEAGKCVADDDGRPGVADRKPAAHEKTGADRPAEPDHDDLRLAEAAPKPLFLLAQSVGACALHSSVGCT